MKYGDGSTGLKKYKVAKVDKPTTTPTKPFSSLDYSNGYKTTPFSSADYANGNKVKPFSSVVKPEDTTVSEQKYVAPPQNVDTSFVEPIAKPKPLVNMTTLKELERKDTEKKVNLAYTVGSVANNTATPTEEKMKVDNTHYILLTDKLKNEYQRYLAVQSGRSKSEIDNNITLTDYIFDVVGIENVQKYLYDNKQWDRYKEVASMETDVAGGNKLTVEKQLEIWNRKDRKNDMTYKEAKTWEALNKMVGEGKILASEAETAFSKIGKMEILDLESGYFNISQYTSDVLSKNQTFVNSYLDLINKKDFSGAQSLMVQAIKMEAYKDPNVRFLPLIVQNIPLNNVFVQPMWIGVKEDPKDPTDVVLKNFVKNVANYADGAWGWIGDLGITIQNYISNWSLDNSKKRIEEAQSSGTFTITNQLPDNHGLDTTVKLSKEEADKLVEIEKDNIDKASSRAKATFEILNTHQQEFDRQTLTLQLEFMKYNDQLGTIAFAGQVGQTIGMMVPTIVVSMAVTGVSIASNGLAISPLVSMLAPYLATPLMSVSGALTPSIAQAMGLSAMGASIFSQTYSRDIIDGVDYQTAYLHSMLSTALELVAETLLSKSINGFSIMPSGIADKLFTQEISKQSSRVLLSSAKTSAMRVLGNLAIEMADEGGEEVFSELFSKALTDLVKYKIGSDEQEINMEEFMAIVWSDMWDTVLTDEGRSRVSSSFWMGAITAGVMSSSQIAVLSWKNIGEYMGGDRLVKIETSKLGEELVKQQKFNIKKAQVGDIVLNFEKRDKNGKLVSIQKINLDLSNDATSSKEVSFQAFSDLISDTIEQMEKKDFTLAQSGTGEMYDNYILDGEGNIQYDEKGNAKIDGKAVVASRYGVEKATRVVLDPTTNKPLLDRDGDPIMELAVDKDTKQLYNVIDGRRNLYQTLTHEVFHAMILDYQKNHTGLNLLSILTKVFSKEVIFDSKANYRLDGAKYVKTSVGYKMEIIEGSNLDKKNVYRDPEFKGDLILGTIGYAVFVKRALSSDYNQMNSDGTPKMDYLAVEEELMVDWLATVLCDKPFLLKRILKLEGLEGASTTKDFINEVILSKFSKELMADKTKYGTVSRYMKLGGAQLVAERLQAILTASEMDVSNEQLYDNVLNNIETQPLVQTDLQKATRKANNLRVGISNTLRINNKTFKKFNKLQNAPTNFTSDGQFISEKQIATTPNSLNAGELSNVLFKDLPVDKSERKILDGVVVPYEQLKNTLNDSMDLLNKIEHYSTVLRNYLISPSVRVEKVSDGYKVRIALNVSDKVLQHLSLRLGNFTIQSIDGKVENVKDRVFTDKIGIYVRGTRTNQDTERPVDNKMSELSTSVNGLAELNKLLKNYENMNIRIVDNPDTKKLIAFVKDKVKTIKKLIGAIDVLTNIGHVENANELVSELDTKLSKDNQNALYSLYGHNGEAKALFDNLNNSIDDIRELNSPSKQQALESEEQLEALLLTDAYKTINDDTRHNGYYSELRNVLIRKMGERATVAEIRGLAKQAPSYESEYYLNTLLSAYTENDILSKDDVLKHLYKNEPKLETIESPAGHYKFSNWMFGEEKNYRTKQIYGWGTYIGASQDGSGHFGAQSVSHILTTEMYAQGEQSNIFLEETQSDVHEAGAKFGYNRPKNDLGIVKRTKEILETYNSYMPVLLKEEDLLKDTNTILTDTSVYASYTAGTGRMGGTIRYYDPKIDTFEQLKKEFISFYAFSEAYDVMRYRSERPIVIKDYYAEAIRTLGNSGLNIRDLTRARNSFLSSGDNYVQEKARGFIQYAVSEGVEGAIAEIQKRTGATFKLQVYDIYKTYSDLVENGFKPRNDIEEQIVNGDVLTFSDDIKSSIEMAKREILINQIGQNEYLSKSSEELEKLLEETKVPESEVPDIVRQMSNMTRPAEIMKALNIPPPSQSGAGFNMANFGFGQTGDFESNGFITKSINSAYSISVRDFKHVETDIKLVAGFRYDSDGNLEADIITARTYNATSQGFSASRARNGVIQINVEIVTQAKILNSYGVPSNLTVDEIRLSQKQVFYVNVDPTINGGTIPYNFMLANMEGAGIRAKAQTLGAMNAIPFNRDWAHIAHPELTTDQFVNELQNRFTTLKDLYREGLAIQDEQNANGTRRAPMPFMDDGWKINNIQQAIKFAVKLGKERLYLSNGLLPSIRWGGDDNTMVFTSATFLDVRMTIRDKSFNFNYLNNSQKNGFYKWANANIAKLGAEQDKAQVEIDKEQDLPTYEQIYSNLVNKKAKTNANLAVNELMKEGKIKKDERFAKVEELTLSEAIKLKTDASIELEATAKFEAQQQEIQNLDEKIELLREKINWFDDLVMVRVSGLYEYSFEYELDGYNAKRTKTLVHRSMMLFDDGRFFKDHDPSMIIEYYKYLPSEDMNYSQLPKDSFLKILEEVQKNGLVSKLGNIKVSGNMYLKNNGGQDETMSAMPINLEENYTTDTERFNGMSFQYDRVNMSEIKKIARRTGAKVGVEYVSKAPIQSVNTDEKHILSAVKALIEPEFQNFWKKFYNVDRANLSDYGNIDTSKIINEGIKNILTDISQDGIIAISEIYDAEDTFEQNSVLNYLEQSPYEKWAHLELAKRYDDGGAPLTFESLDNTTGEIITNIKVPDHIFLQSMMSYFNYAGIYKNRSDNPYAQKNDSGAFILDVKKRFFEAYNGDESLKGLKYDTSSVFVRTVDMVAVSSFEDAFRVVYDGGLMIDDYTFKDTKVWKYISTKLLSTMIKPFMDHNYPSLIGKFNPMFINQLAKVIGGLAGIPVKNMENDTDIPTAHKPSEYMTWTMYKLVDTLQGVAQVTKLNIEDVRKSNGQLLRENPDFLKQKFENLSVYYSEQAVMNIVNRVGYNTPEGAFLQEYQNLTRKLSSGVMFLTRTNINGKTWDAVPSLDTPYLKDKKFTRKLISNENISPLGKSTIIMGNILNDLNSRESTLQDGIAHLRDLLLWVNASYNMVNIFSKEAVATNLDDVKAYVKHHQKEMFDAINDFRNELGKEFELVDDLRERTEIYENTIRNRDRDKINELDNYLGKEGDGPIANKALLEKLNKPENINDYSYLMKAYVNGLIRSNYIEINDEIKKQFSEDSKLPILQALEKNDYSRSYQLNLPLLTDEIKKYAEKLQERKNYLPYEDALSTINNNDVKVDFKDAMLGKYNVSKGDVKQFFDKFSKENKEINVSRIKDRIMSMFTSEKLPDGHIMVAELYDLINSNYVYYDMAKWSGVLDFVNETMNNDKTAYIDVSDMGSFNVRVPQVKVVERSTSDQFGKYPHYYGYSTTSKVDVQGYSGNVLRLNDDGYYKEIIFTADKNYIGALNVLKDFHYSTFDNMIGETRITVGVNWDSKLINWASTKATIVEEIESKYASRKSIKLGSANIQQASNYANAVNGVFDAYRKDTTQRAKRSMDNGSRFAIMDRGHLRYSTTVENYISKQYGTDYEIKNKDLVRTEDGVNYYTYRLSRENSNIIKDLSVVEYVDQDALLMALDYKLMNDSTSSLPANTATEQEQSSATSDAGLVSVNSHVNALMNDMYFGEAPIIEVPFSNPTLFNKVALQKVIEQSLERGDNMLLLTSGAEQALRYVHEQSQSPIKEVLATRANIDVNNGLVDIELHTTVLEGGDYKNKSESFSFNASLFSTKQYPVSVSNINDPVNANFEILKNIWMVKEALTPEEYASVKDYVSMMLDNVPNSSIINGLGLVNGLELNLMRNKTFSNTPIISMTDWGTSQQAQSLGALLMSSSLTTKQRNIARLVYQSRYNDGAYKDFRDGNHYNFDKLNKGVAFGDVRGELISVRFNAFSKFYDDTLVNMLADSYSAYGVKPSFIWVGLDVEKNFNELKDELLALEPQASRLINRLDFNGRSLQDDYNSLKNITKTISTNQEFYSKVLEMGTFVREITQYMDKDLSSTDYQNHLYDVARAEHHGMFMTKIQLTDAMSVSFDNYKKQALEIDVDAQMAIQSNNLQVEYLDGHPRSIVELMSSTGETVIQVLSNTNGLNNGISGYLVDGEVYTEQQLLKNIENGVYPSNFKAEKFSLEKLGNTPEKLTSIEIESLKNVSLVSQVEKDRREQAKKAQEAQDLLNRQLANQARIANRALNVSTPKISAYESMYNGTKDDSIFEKDIPVSVPSLGVDGPELIKNAIGKGKGAFITMAKELYNRGLIGVKGKNLSLNGVSIIDIANSYIPNTAYSYDDYGNNVLATLTHESRTFDSEKEAKDTLLRWVYDFGKLKSASVHNRGARALLNVLLILKSDVALDYMRITSKTSKHESEYNYIVLAKDGTWGMLLHLGGVITDPNTHIYTMYTFDASTIKSKYGVDKETKLGSLGLANESYSLIIEKDTMDAYNDFSKNAGLDEIKKKQEAYDSSPSSATADDLRKTKENYYKNISFVVEYVKDEITPIDGKYEIPSIVLHQAIEEDVDVDSETITKDRKHEKTIIRSKEVEAKTIRTVDAMIKKGEFRYDVVSDKKSLMTANDIIAEDLEKAYQDFESAFRSNRRMTKVDIAVAELLIAEMSKENSGVKAKNRKIMNLISDLAILGTEMGQSVQALSLINKLSGEGQWLHLRRLMDRMEKKYQEQGKGVKFDVSDELVNELIGKKNPAEIQVVVEKIKLVIIDQIPSSFMDKFTAWRYLSMLGNPRTHIRNILGNMMMLPMIRTKDFVGMALETFIPVGERTKTPIYSSELRTMAMNDYVEYQAMIKGESKYGLDKELEHNKKVFDSRFMNTLSDGNTKLLDRADFIFSKIHYVNAFASLLSARKLTPQTATVKDIAEARKYAVSEAQKGTFRDYSQLANDLSFLARKYKSFNLILSAIMPFKKTPINITKRVYEYSPVGLSATLTKGLFDLNKKRITTAEFIDQTSAGLTGTGVMLIGYLMYTMGLIGLGAGKDDDTRERLFNQMFGPQKYSIIFYGNSYTIDWAVPASLPLIMGAEIAKYFEEGEMGSLLNVLPQALSDMFDPIFELTMLSGLKNALTSFSSSGSAMVGSAVSTMAESYIGQFVPTIFGQIARIVDPIRRSTYVPSNSEFNATAEGIVRRLMNKIPFLSMLNEPYINQLGEIEYNYDTKNLLAQIFFSMVSVGYYRSSDIGTEAQTILNMYNRTLSSDVLPRIAPNYLTVDGKKIILTASQKTQFSKDMGGTSKTMVGDMIDSGIWKSMTLDEQVDMYSKIYEYSYQMALAKITNNPSKWYLKVKIGQLQLIQPFTYFKAEMVYNNVVGNDTITKEYAYVDALIPLGLTVSQIEYMLTTQNYKVSTKDHAYIVARKGAY